MHQPTVLNLEISTSKRVLKYSCQEVIDIWLGQLGNPSKGWLFPQTRDPDKPLSEKGYKKSWAKVLDHAGFTVDMYCFRHNFISTFIREGVNLKLIATLVGHKTTEMIERHYAHHFPSDVGYAMDMM